MKISRCPKVIPAMAVVAAALLMMMGVAAGCGAGAGGTSTSDAIQGAETTQAGRSTVTLTDQAGRTVTVPNPIKSVYCTSPMGTNLMYMLAPDMLVGWNISPTALEKQYIPEQYRSVVGLGGWFGKNTTGNVEEIIKRAPDVVLSLGTLDAAAISDADRIQGLLNIPVIIIDGSLVRSGDTLRYIGKLLGVEARAEELAAYCDGVIEEARANTAKLPESKRVGVYYAEGNKGLNTDQEGSEHTEVLELVGGANVAQVDQVSEYGMAAVSLEQVLAWNPETILVASDPAQESNVYEQITTSSDWATVTAVKEKRVYQVPRGPFDWFDRPPSISRILGIRWLGNLLYPDLYRYDMKAEVKAFYKLFYHFDPSDAQLQELMARAVRIQ
jgi:iron complex transport system substrate-binding protein